MKPVMQTVLGSPYGNCFQACLASLLELPIDLVPEFRRIQTDNSGKCMVTESQNWLRETQKKRFISIEMYNQDGIPRTDICLLNRTICKDEFVLLSGESPRKDQNGNTFYHCVVGQQSIWGFEVVHDPHPEGGGIIGQPYGVKWLVNV